MLYLGCRSQELLMLRWANYLGLSRIVNSWRKFCFQYPLSEWCYYALPDGLWLLSYILKSLLFYKQKKVSRKQYGKKWPFKSESVILESRDGRYYIVIIEGYEYALNGKTSNWLKLPTPNKAGVAISYKSTEDFLRMAQQL